VEEDYECLFMLTNIIKELKKNAEPNRKEVFLKFFKTGKEEYGEGDRFLGIAVPKTRVIAQKYKNLTLFDLQKLLKSKIHEHRLCALMILRMQYEETKDKKLVDFYLANTKNINNWDLVDLSAGYILGDWLLDKDRRLLYRLSKSKNLWERRIAVISTSTFIRENQFEDTIKISEILLSDKHDLIHKAVGWMLRETGKRDQKLLEDFLQKHAKQMPRVMLRYAIEKLDEKKRKFYLS